MNTTAIKGFSTETAAQRYIAKHWAHEPNIGIQFITGGTYLVVVR
jgi:hypothetical protein